MSLIRSSSRLLGSICFSMTALSTVTTLYRIPVTYIFQQRWISECSFLAYIINSQHGMMLQSQRTVGNFSLLLILSCFYSFLKISAIESGVFTTENSTQLHDPDLMLIYLLFDCSAAFTLCHLIYVYVVSAGILCRYCRVCTLTVTGWRSAYTGYMRVETLLC